MHQIIIIFVRILLLISIWLNHFSLLCLRNYQFCVKQGGCGEKWLLLIWLQQLIKQQVQCADHLMALNNLMEARGWVHTFPLLQSPQLSNIFDIYRDDCKHVLPKKESLMWCWENFYKLFHIVMEDQLLFAACFQRESKKCFLKLRQSQDQHGVTWMETHSFCLRS